MGKNYQGCREDFFINPLVENLKTKGIDYIIGEGMEHIDPRNVQIRFFNKNFVEKNDK